jgi:DNA repair exonuclease SbcCD ATPase subunit
MDPNTQPIQNDNSSPAPTMKPIPSINELEAAFENSMKEESVSQEEISAPATQTGNGMSQKIADLQSTDKRIEEKSAHLKSVVSQKLALLKDLKNEIGGLIDEIKELEETRTKIAEEITKLTTLAGEVSALEKEAESELE